MNSDPTKLASTNFDLTRIAQIMRNPHRHNAIVNALDHATAAQQTLLGLLTDWPEKLESFMADQPMIDSKWIREFERLSSAVSEWRNEVAIFEIATSDDPYVESIRRFGEPKEAKAVLEQLGLPTGYDDDEEDYDDDDDEDYDDEDEEDDE